MAAKAVRNSTKDGGLKLKDMKKRGEAQLQLEMRKKKKKNRSSEEKQLKQLKKAMKRLEK